jgi:4-hydroxyphenylpyruvate dioxygenase
MRSKVVQSADGQIRFPLMEPATGRKKSQIERYIECHHGPGTQHLAFRSTDIVKSVSALASAGLEFLPTPDAYYQSLEARVGHVKDLDTLRKFGILADRDAAGMLFQIFTRPIGSRATLFIEIVERLGAVGFGTGNIKALFEAVERAGELSAGA